jgi:hypothetical protein
MQKLKQLGAVDWADSDAQEESIPAPDLTPVMEAEWPEFSLNSAQNLQNPSDERRRKITTLENWLAAIRRDRS